MLLADVLEGEMGLTSMSVRNEKDHLNQRDTLKKKLVTMVDMLIAF